MKWEEEGVSWKMKRPIYLVSVEAVKVVVEL
jgi:hypothetical protein